ncbi:MAG: DUF1294 domain-containing protein [Planctomycetes bacterium]|nr:DUF1294 domain-containing protein [Planctomycetota bacterium]
MTIPLGILALALLVTNLVAFVAQGLDKRKAVNHARSRTPELTLLLLGLPMAAAGMLLGMRVFRHKTKKRSFQVKALLVVFANLLMAVLFGWLATKGHVRVTLVLY